MHGLGVRPAACSDSQGCDDPGAELVAQVEREVREAEVVGDAPGAAHGGRAAARALAVVAGLGPQLERHGDDLGAGPRALSSAATALSTPPDIATSVRPGSRRDLAVGAHGAAERAVQRVGGEVGGVQLARRSDRRARRRCAAS